MSNKEQRGHLLNAKHSYGLAVSRPHSAGFGAQTPGLLRRKVSTASEDFISVLKTSRLQGAVCSRSSSVSAWCSPPQRAGITFKTGKTQHDAIPAAVGHDLPLPFGIPNRSPTLPASRCRDKAFYPKTAPENASPRGSRPEHPGAAPRRPLPARTPLPAATSAGRGPRRRPPPAGGRAPRPAAPAPYLAAPPGPPLALPAAAARRGCRAEPPLPHGRASGLGAAAAAARGKRAPSPQPPAPTPQLSSAQLSSLPEGCRGLPAAQRTALIPHPPPAGPHSPPGRAAPGPSRPPLSPLSPSAPQRGAPRYRPPRPGPAPPATEGRDGAGRAAPLRMLGASPPRPSPQPDVSWALAGGRQAPRCLREGARGSSRPPDPGCCAPALLGFGVRRPASARTETWGYFSILPCLLHQAPQKAVLGRRNESPVISIACSLLAGSAAWAVHGGASSACAPF